MTVSPLLTEAQIEEFQTKGVIVLRGIFQDWVEPVRQAIEENKANPSWRERTYHPDDGSAPFFQDYVVWNQFDGYRALVKDSPMAELAARLMRSKTARAFHDHILVKEPGNSIVTPWHQDQPYYLVDGQQSISFWVPLDTVARDCTPEFVAGSHRWGKDFKPMRFDGTELFPGDQSPAAPDVEAERSNLDILGWDLAPGDAVAFNFRCLHGAPANSSATRRRAISMRWVGDDAVFAKRQGTTSPAFPDLTFEDGAPFDGPDFPVLYQEA